MASLTELSTPKRHGEQFQIDIPEGWKQGRGAFGGFTIGSLIRAIEAKVGDAARRVHS